MKRVVSAVLLALLAWVVSPVGGETLVGWRNDGTGCFTSTTPPLEWSRTSNVLWKVELPGTSYAAPIVVGDHVYVASDPGDLLCVLRKDGKIVWRKGHADVKAPAAGRGRGGPGGGKGGRGGDGRTAGNSAATPVSDGKRIAALFGNGVVAVYQPDGKRLWARFIESPRIEKGLSASPLLSGDKLIVHIKDMLALDVSTGEEAWRASLTATHASPCWPVWARRMSWLARRARSCALATARSWAKALSAPRTVPRSWRATRFTLPGAARSSCPCPARTN
jgi:outer membrane protein assembly factor BamB